MMMIRWRELLEVEGWKTKDDLDECDERLGLVLVYKDTLDQNGWWDGGNDSDLSG